MPDRTPFVGPIFFWELIRQSRKGRGYFPRLAYAGVMLGVLFLLLGGGEITHKNAAYISERAVFHYLAVQYAAVLLLTPVFVAGAFIEDRQQNTLQLLLTTFLSPREIVLGKLFGRLIYVAGTLLAGLPVLALLQLLGGVDLTVLLSHTGLALGMMVICGLYAIRASTLCRTVGGAILMTYTMLAGGYLLGSIVAIPWGLFVMRWMFPGSLFLLWLPILGINVLCASVALRLAIRSIGNRERDVDYGALQARGEQAAFDLSRKVQVVEIPVPTPAPKEGSQGSAERVIQPATQRIHRAIRWKRLPAVWDRPVLWKETYFPVSDVDVLIACICCGLPLTVFLSSFVTHQTFLAVRPFVAWCCQAMMLLVLVLTTLRACGVFTQERLQRTLVSLLSTPLTTTDVVVQAWLGNVWRFGACLLGTLILGLALLTYQPLAGLMLLITFLAQLACYTTAGALLSTSRLTPFQARCLVGSFLFAGLVLPAFLGSGVEELPFCLTLLLCPYFALGLIQGRFEWQGSLGSVRTSLPELPRPGLFEPDYLGGFAVLEGIVLCIALSALFLLLTRHRLRHMSET